MFFKSFLTSKTFFYIFHIYSILHIAFFSTNLAFAQPVRVSSTVATRLRGASTLPSTCAAGEIYRDSDATSGQQVYLCESTNTWVLQGDGGGASGWTDDGTELRLTTSTDEVEIGSAATLSAKLAVNGDANEIQALIQGNATQTTDILVIEKSDGTDILTGGVGGIKSTGGLAVTNLISCDTIDTDASGVMFCGSDSGAASGAPSTADYLVGTADGGLSAEIVVGTTPGGELEGTWGTPTIDNTGIALTSLTVGALLGVDSIDATGAVDMDYGSADVTDHTFISDNGTNVVLDGTASTIGASAIIHNDAMDASSELLAIMDDETGTGALVFGTSPTFTTSITATNLIVDAHLNTTESINLPIYSAKLTGAFVVFTPPTADACTQGAQIDAGDGNWRLLFDPTTDECATWQFVLPDYWAAHSELKIFYTMTSATANEVDFEAAVMCVTPGDAADIGTAGFANVATASDTVPGTVGYLDSVSITITDDSCAAGDVVFVVISKDANDATLDDATGDTEVVGVVYEFTR